MLHRDAHRLPPLAGLQQVVVRFDQRTHVLQVARLQAARHGDAAPVGGRLPVGRAPVVAVREQVLAQRRVERVHPLLAGARLLQQGAAPQSLHRLAAALRLGRLTAFAEHVAQRRERYRAAVDGDAGEQPPRLAVRHPADRRSLERVAVGGQQIVTLTQSGSIKALVPGDLGRPDEELRIAAHPPRDAVEVAVLALDAVVAQQLSGVGALKPAEQHLVVATGSKVQASRLLAACQQHNAAMRVPRQ